MYILHHTPDSAALIVRLVLEAVENGAWSARVVYDQRP